MNPLLECCEQNLAKGTQSVISDSFLEKEVDLVTYSCMNQCDMCAKSFYGLFEGEIVSESTVENFVTQVGKKVAEWKIEMN